ncbi:NAD(P)/FAD-dependent oxidoreductase [Sporobolomyces salmoneus]|uniref:NAD(P)/FAD-dependent oxidoreductase n=1 Tax=Sporobolomyces salmoneus TaxID=183962 RepID=UPI00317D5EC8
MLRRQYPYLAPSLTVDTLVIGGGVVGLAIAERLTKAFVDKTTFLVERHGQVGQETSSRNSEVIHSGIYYPPNSLKTSLCIRGRDLLYSRCKEHGIPYRQTGKLVLASSKDQEKYLEKLFAKSKELKRNRLEVPLEWLSGDEVRELEPDVGERVVSALRSPLTGIVDSHSLMENLEKEIMDSETGELVYGTRAVRIDRHEPTGGGKRGDGTESGWVVQTVTDDGSGGEGERTAVLAKSVVNAAGLNAHHILNQILPDDKKLRLHFAKGSYFSYRGPGVSNVKHLLYPCPEENVSLSGLGTHLTMSLDNEIRFGPDVQWLDPPLENGEDVPDFWEQNLAADEERMSLAIEEVQKFLPQVKAEGFSPDYAGIRPKLSKKGETAVDFSITHPQPGFVSLTGIESPGLTSSLAIAEMVEGIMRKEVWGLGKGTGKTVSEGGRLEGWA